MEWAEHGAQAASGSCHVCVSAAEDKFAQVSCQCKHWQKWSSADIVGLGNFCYDKSFMRFIEFRWYSRTLLILHMHFDCHNHNSHYAKLKTVVFNNAFFFFFYLLILAKLNATQKFPAVRYPPHC